MKKLRFWLATIAVLLCSVSVSAHDFEVDGFYYDITSEADLTVEVTYKGEERASYSNEYTGVLAIPESVTYNGKNYSVTGINYDAFYECPDLTNITIPNSVTSIGAYAFMGCSNLTNITIGNSVTNIGTGAFIGTQWMKNQADGVVYMDYILLGCKGAYPMGAIEIKDDTRIIGDLAFNGRTDLTSITIPNSVTNIGERAFEGCSSLTSITIGNSVTNIEMNAFNKTQWMKNQADGVVYLDYILLGYKGEKPTGAIEIKDGTRIIGDYAFYECPGLTSITIPNSVTSIGKYAFYGCSGLTSITIPNSVTSIGRYAFLRCDELKLVINFSDLIIVKGSTSHGYVGRDANKVINADEQIEDFFFRTDSDGNHYLSGYIGNDSDLTLPNDYKGMSYKIDSRVFEDCTSLTSITIPNSVTSIGEDAFIYCTGLTNITIPNSVTSIGEDAFLACYGLKLVINFSDLNIEKGAETHGEVAYYASKVINADEQVGDFFFRTDSDGNHYLSAYLGYDTDLTLPNDYKGMYYSIESSVFEDCTSLTSITIPNSVTSIGSFAFYSCSGLTSVTIGNSVTSIGDYAFSGCSGLTSVTIGNSVTSIGDWAFYKCSGLTSVTIGNSVTSIGDSAFRECTDLTSITIPNSVTSIGAYTFNNCSFTSVTIPNSVTSIGKEAFSYTDLTSITIPNSVTSIGDYAFSGCSNLKTVINFSNLAISKGSKSNGYVGYYANKVINADEQIGNFFFKTTKNVHSLNGYLGDEGNLELPQDYKGNKYSIGESVFSGYSGLTSIIIPNTVTSIGASAFSGCKGIKELIIEDGSTYIDLGYSQFIDCPLEYVYIGRNHSYTNNPFKEGNTLKTVVIGPNVTRIGNYLFDYCKGLKSVTIPNSVTIIGNYAFRGCSGLTSVTIPNSVTSIGEYAFYSCSGLTNVTIPNSVTSIGNSVFEGCSSLKDLYIGSSVTSIGDNLLTNCTNLNTLSVGAKIPPTVNDLGLGSQQYFTVKLQVPEGAKAMYQFAEAWKKFFNIEEFDPTGIANVTPDAEEKNLPIYNLQGARMTEDRENLPTGIYIQGGKKIFIK